MSGLTVEFSSPALLLIMTLSNLHLFLKRILLLSFLLVCFLGSFPNPAQAELTTINVEIERAKANSNQWDAMNRAPDIAICLTNQLVGMMCFPDGNQVELVTKPQCPNSFKCKFTADVPEGNFKISVVDVDVAFNDPIGTGLCHTGTTCEIGQAKVTIGNPQHRRS